MAELFEADVPVKTQTVDLMGTTITYQCVDEENKQIAKYVPLVNWNSDNALVHRFGAILEASKKQPELCSLIELGSGLGIPALFIAKNYPFHTLRINDGDFTAIEFIQKNVAANVPYRAKNVEVTEFWWFADTASLTMEQAKAISHKYDIVLGSDVIYDPATVRSLLFTIAQLLKPDGVAILANFYSRFYKNEAEFYKTAKEVRLSVEMTAVGEKGETIECILRLEG